MKYDVFISYSSRNKDVANAICHVLEENMFKCWMAPRDIPVGSKYASVIKDAIVSSKVFVLVFSEYAAVSPWVESELNMAFSNRKIIIPYKVDKALVEDYDEFYVRLNNRHWIDSFPDFHERFNELIQVVSANVSIESSSPSVERTWKVGDYYNVDGKNRTSETAAEPIVQSKPEPLCPCGSGKLFKDCHGKTVVKQETASPKPIGQKPVASVVPKSAPPKPVERTWKVGDYYSVDGKEGVVFWVDKTGKHGKIVSLDQKQLLWCTYDEYKYKYRCIRDIGVDEQDGMKNQQSIVEIYDWRNKYPAFAWSADHGDGWYLPAIEELKLLLLNDGVHDAVNARIERLGKIKLFSKGEHGGWYWSSTKYDEYCAWIIAVGNGFKSRTNMNLASYVRAVSAF